MLTMIRVVIFVSAVAAVMTWAMYWWVRASLSENLSSRRHARAAEILLSLGMCVFWGAQVTRTYERKLAVLLIAVVTGIWLFRGTRFLLHKRKHV